MNPIEGDSWTEMRDRLHLHQIVWDIFDRGHFVGQVSDEREAMERWEKLISSLPEDVVPMSKHCSLKRYEMCMKHICPIKVVTVERFDVISEGTSVV